MNYLDDNEEHDLEETSEMRSQAEIIREYHYPMNTYKERADLFLTQSRLTNEMGKLSRNGNSSKT